MPYFTHPLWIKRKLQLLVEESLSYRIYVYPGRTHGHQEIDIKRVGWPITTIFDVGANIGQTVLKFAAAFPRAQIHCFEPVYES